MDVNKNQTKVIVTKYGFSTCKYTTFENAFKKLPLFYYKNTFKAINFEFNIVEK